MRFRVRAPSQLSSTRRWLLCTLALAIMAASALVGSPQVDATTGVDDYPARLKNAAQNALVDPWLFYNRECTSFVAWRLNNDAGVPFHNYYLGKHWGDASNWASAARQAGVTVDETPTKGAVAWWRAGSPGSSRGHVAWVARASGGEITIEEYNYLAAGRYDTRTIGSTSSVWPSAFIHIDDVALHSTAPPVISGVAQVGTRLTATRGSWTASGLDFSYQWLADGVAVRGATRKAFKPDAEQLGARIQVRVVATKPGVDSATASSAKSTKVKLGVFSTTQSPTVQGTAQVGRPLRVAKGTWSPKGAYAYQWYAGPDRVRGASDTTFTPSAKQLSMPITVRVTATRTGYRPATRAAAPSAPVAPGIFVNDEPPSIDGFAQVGSRLTASAGNWSPRGEPSYQWFVDGEPLVGATSATYKPVAADVRRQITVQVTVQRTGYTTATATSAPTDAVVPGTFINTRDASISGTPQVGVRLKADPGGWSPRASLEIQWYVGDQPIPDATGSTYRPTPADVGRAITAQVTASRPGYLTAVVRSAPTVGVARGIIDNQGPPSISGVAIVGGKLTATPGSWSVTPDNISYQWRIDGKPIEGATDPTYLPTSSDGAHKLSVRVTVGAAGYETARMSSAFVRVLRGHASFAHAPRIHGRAVVGTVLTVSTGSLSPSDVELTYQWYRGTHAIHGADLATYQLRGRDLGDRISVEVTISADDWVPATRRSAKTEVVQPRPG